MNDITIKEITNEKIQVLEPQPPALKPVTWLAQLVRLAWSRSSAIDIVALVGLTIAAVMPRIILAAQLDMVTDEGTYIKGGQIYLPLLLHFDIDASQWMFNYEHPPFVKLLIGLSLAMNAHLGNMLGNLIAARLPSIIFGTLLVVAIYWLGRAPVGRVVALLAALCLAFSPWLAYFSALAYLDMTMTALITMAYLLLWPAIRKPRLYLLVAALVGLGVASKYTASLAIPGIVLFTVYYFFVIRFRLLPDQRPAIPWRWWTASLALAPIVFFIVDPAIWRDPLSLLKQSFSFEWQQSVEGHLTFLAGQYNGHVPHWAILYIIFAKMSIFVTIPAAFFVLYALVQLVRFHLHKSKMPVSEAASIAFLFIWVLSILGMFSLLNIVVGTHYHLPLAPPVALAGASGLAVLLRYRRGSIVVNQTTSKEIQASQVAQEAAVTTALQLHTRSRINPQAAMVLIVMTALLVIPHFMGVTMVYGAEGYTSEAFQGENNAIQVAYPAYREAGIWLLEHTRGTGNVGLVAIPGTVTAGYSTIGWATYNKDLLGRLKFSEVHVNNISFSDDYLVWPMHLVQRGYTPPLFWRSRVVHTIKGGNTIYCFIMARDPGTLIL